MLAEQSFINIFNRCEPIDKLPGRHIDIVNKKG